MNTQEKLDAQNTFVWLEHDRPCRLHTIWLSNGIIVRTMTSARVQEDPFTAPLSADPARVSAIHVTFSPNRLAWNKLKLRV